MANAELKQRNLADSTAAVRFYDFNGTKTGPNNSMSASLSWMVTV
jgi:hypothetical protein